MIFGGMRKNELRNLKWVDLEHSPGWIRVGRLESATFHTLRHTFASWAIQRGVPIAEVQQYLGHSSDHMTRRYAHLACAARERRNTLEILVGDGTHLAHSLAPPSRAL